MIIEDSKFVELCERDAYRRGFEEARTAAAQVVRTEMHIHNTVGDPVDLPYVIDQIEALKPEASQ